MAAEPTRAAPRAALRVSDGLALMVGMVVGIGIFKAPSLVASRLDDPWVILGLWVAGALVVLVGALCYAELATAFPDAGGEYHFLTRAFGPATGFLFAWGRLAVVQTGAIAAVGFVLGDYAQELLHIGPMGPSLYAGAAVIGLTALNVRGTPVSARVQNLLAAALVAAVLAAALAGFALGGGVEAAGAMALEGAGAAGSGRETTLAAIGFAMIFVMLTYGGWNEVAYLSAELGDVRRNMVRVILLGTLVVTVLYIAINGAYLRILGPAAMGASEAIGADYMRALVGSPGATVLSLVIIAAALTTMNATIFTGARSAYAMARDSGLFGPIGRWDVRAAGPVNAHLVQGALALALVGLGTATRQGFSTMVEYTAPVFWFFLLLTGVALFVLRRGGLPAGTYRVPLYPLTPALFCASSAFMLHASLAYTEVGALIGVGIVALGIPVWWLARRRAPGPAV
ncbi:MAG TPA: amino acid permease [Alphaproteobacteria bacterium]